MRMVIGCGLLVAFPAWMYAMADQPFLVYIYSAMGEALLAVYLILSSAHD